MSALPTPVRIVGINFLNARPLLAGLVAGAPAPFPYEFVTAEPSSCARQLATGSVAAALVPVATLPFLRDVAPVGDLGVACSGAVRSVLLISRVEPAAIGTLAAHGASRSSVILARLLLAERWGVRPQLVPAAPPLDLMMAEADAAVIIGDPALLVQGRSGLHEIDLGQAWAEWTGLPFVFAVWAARVPAPVGLGELLAASYAYARTNWPDLVPAWASDHQVPEPTVEAYFRDNLHFELGGRERTAIAEFLARAEAAGVLQLFPAPPGMA
jgi:chorismate dehydratase